MCLQGRHVACPWFYTVGGTNRTTPLHFLLLWNRVCLCVLCCNTSAVSLELVCPPIPAIHAIALAGQAAPFALLLPDVASAAWLRSSVSEVIHHRNTHESAPLVCLTTGSQRGVFLFLETEYRKPRASAWLRVSGSVFLQ